MTHSFITPEEEKILQLVEQGYYTAGRGEDDAESVSLFYTDYETTLSMLQVKRVPLAFDAQKRRFHFLPEFMAKADPGEFEKWRAQFRKNYERFAEEGYEYFADDDEDGNDDIGRLPAEPDLDYRTANWLYAQCVLEKIMDIPAEYPDEVLDDYGWIESRRQKFYGHLTFCCERYALPRLPVKFDTPDHVPKFLAAEEEVALFSTLVQERYKTMEEQDDSGKNLGHDRAAIRENLKRIWAEENSRLRFPSAIAGYPAEVAQEFRENNEEINLEQDCGLVPGKSNIPQQNFNLN